MKLAFRSIAAASSLSALLAMTACGGGGDSGAPPLSIAFSTAPPTSMALHTTASVAALVVNDPSNGGVNWTVACGGADCGSVSSTSTVSGGATVYTSPATAPNPASVTITATAASDSTQKVSSTIAIAAPAGPLLADGTYVFHVSGQDSAGSFTSVGAFTVVGGAITGGEEDFSDPNGGYTNSIAPATSSLTAAGSNVQIALDTGNPAIGVNGVETLRGTVVSASRLLISEFNQSAQGTGSLDLQTSNATPAGGYAFAVSGNDTNGNALSIGGILNFDSGALSSAGSVFDISEFNQNTNTAAVIRSQLFQSGSVTTPDAFGRVVITLTPAFTTGVPEFQLAGFIVSPGRIHLVESAEADDALNANTGGAALGQGANTGLFTPTSSSVVGQSYAHGSAGTDPNGGTVLSGAFALNADGTVGGVIAVNDLNSIGAWTLGGSYAVDPTGRVTVTISSLSSQTATPPASTMTFELYLDGNGNAMVMSADTFQTTQGIAFVQNGATALAGNYALAAQGVINASSGAYAWSAIGPATVDAGTFSGATDINVATQTPMSAVVLGGVQDASRGLLQLTGLDAANFSAATAYGYYPVSGNRLWAIEVDGAGASLLLMEGVTR